MVSISDPLPTNRFFHDPYAAMELGHSFPCVDGGSTRVSNPMTAAMPCQLPNHTNAHGSVSVFLHASHQGYAGVGRDEKTYFSLRQYGLLSSPASQLLDPKSMYCCARRLHRECHGRSSCHGIGRVSFRRRSEWHAPGRCHEWQFIWDR